MPANRASGDPNKILVERPYPGLCPECGCLVPVGLADRGRMVLCDQCRTRDGDHAHAGR